MTTKNISTNDIHEVISKKMKDSKTVKRYLRMAINEAQKHEIFNESEQENMSKILERLAQNEKIQKDFLKTLN